MKTPGGFMRAIVKTKPAVGAEFLDVPVPDRLAPGWVLIKVRATSICGTDVHIWNWDPWSQGRIGEKKLPQTLGHECCGEVVEVGPYCNRIKVGDYVSCETHIYDPADLTSMLGVLHVGKNMKILGVDTNGCFAEYIAAPEIVLWKNDRSLAPELASVQEPLGNACYCLLGEDNDIYGKRVLIVGDGPIALFSVGIAKAAGASKIFQIGMADYNLKIGKVMGADVQMNILKEDSSQRLQRVLDETDGFGVDVACEMAGATAAIDDALRMVRKGGRVSAFGVLSQSPAPIDYNNGIVFKGAQIHGINGRLIFDTWYRNGMMLSAGKLDIKPVITHLFPIEEYKAAFDLLTANPRECAKIVLFPDKSELEAAKKRMGI